MGKMKKGSFEKFEDTYRIFTEDQKYDFKLPENMFELIKGDMEEGGYELTEVEKPKTYNKERALKINDFSVMGLKFDKASIKLEDGDYIITELETGNIVTFPAIYEYRAFEYILILEKEA